MVEVNEDPIVVTLKIQRETEAAKQQAVAERAASHAVSSPGELHAEAQTIQPVHTAPRRATDAAAAFRAARLGVAAVLVLALLWAWIRVARAQAARQTDRTR